MRERDEQNPIRNSQILALLEKYPDATYNEVAAKIGGNCTKGVIAGVVDRATRRDNWQRVEPTGFRKRVVPREARP